MAMQPSVPTQKCHYFEIAKSTGSSRPWSTIINDLLSAFNALTEEERCASILKINNAVLQYVGNSAYCYFAKGSANINLVGTAVSFADEKAYSSQNGSQFSEITSNRSETVVLMKLIAD